MSKVSLELTSTFLSADDLEEILEKIDPVIHMMGAFESHIIVIKED